MNAKKIKLVSAIVLVVTMFAFWESHGVLAWLFGTIWTVAFLAFAYARLQE